MRLSPFRMSCIPSPVVFWGCQNFTCIMIPFRTVSQFLDVLRDYLPLCEYIFGTEFERIPYRYQIKIMKRQLKESVSYIARCKIISYRTRCGYGLFGLLYFLVLADKESLALALALNRDSQFAVRIRRPSSFAILRFNVAIP